MLVVNIGIQIGQTYEDNLQSFNSKPPTTSYEINIIL